MQRKIKIATRKSPLALYQAAFVKSALLKIDASLQIELIKIVTEGDQKLDQSLSKYGGKGLFIKALEEAIFDHEADLAVHSMKDMTVELPSGLMIAACCERHDPRDAFVSNQYKTIDEMPNGAIIGTSSLRRQSQILACRPDLQIKLLRGNVGTRLAKLDNEEYDAIILAAAGLQRLDLSSRIKQYLPIALCLPAVGQGVIGIECREDDHQLLALLKQLNHDETALCLTAERRMNQKLEGGCQVPIAGFAQIEKDSLILEGRIASPDGQRVIEAKYSGSVSAANQIGENVADDLIKQGAKHIIDSIYHV
ncbi:MAG: hydroxymethylbilane synthase [Legionellales bacterium]|nr:hydroxymethylbilane synthase [Legionellales bacterium]|tara:strand:+ start:807 stop:1733 length:927 start_codon:yes stop_codon:yes gene_type:complete